MVLLTILGKNRVVWFCFLLQEGPASKLEKLSQCLVNSFEIPVNGSFTAGYPANPYLCSGGPSWQTLSLHQPTATAFHPSPYKRNLLVQEGCRWILPVLSSSAPTTWSLHFMCSARCTPCPQDSPLTWFPRISGSDATLWQHVQQGVPFKTGHFPRSLILEGSSLSTGRRKDLTVKCTFWGLVLRLFSAQQSLFNNL